METCRERVYQVFGAKKLARLVEIEPAEDGGRGSPISGSGPNPRPALRLSGFVSEPQFQRSNRNSYHVFVNRRAVRDRLVHRAIGRAYESLLPSGAFPFALLFLDVPPETVDVNVHPAKSEVRFREPGRVFNFVRDTVRGSLAEAKPAADLPAAATVQQQVPAPSDGTPPGWPFPASPPSGTGHRPAGRSTGRLRFGPSPSAPIPARGSGIAPSTANGPDAESGPDVPEPALCSGGDPLVDARPTNLGSLSDLRLLGQVQGSFIVAEGADGVWIIDQHVAHERILFEQVLAARLRGRPVAQRLLVPISVTLTPAQLAVSARLEEELRGNGFEIQRRGERSLDIGSVPAELRPQQAQALLAELLDGASESTGGLTLGDLRKRMAATIACHAAIKINTPLTEEKMRWLLDSLANSDFPMACPHGRPIALKYGMKAILKAFHRA